MFVSFSWKYNKDKEWLKLFNNSIDILKVSECVTSNYNLLSDAYSQTLVKIDFISDNIFM